MPIISGTVHYLNKMISLVEPWKRDLIILRYSTPTSFRYIILDFDIIIEVPTFLGYLP